MKLEQGLQNVGGLATESKQDDIILGTDKLKTITKVIGGAIPADVLMVGLRNSAGNAGTLKGISTNVDALPVNAGGNTLETASLHYIFNGTTWDRMIGDLAKKITVSGTTTYIAMAALGSAQASAVWRVKKIAVSGSDTVITWADGNNSFDNVATDLTTLTYS